MLGILTSCWLFGLEFEVDTRTGCFGTSELSPEDLTTSPRASSLRFSSPGPDAMVLSSQILNAPLAGSRQENARYTWLKTRGLCCQLTSRDELGMKRSASDLVADRFWRSSVLLPPQTGSEFESTKLNDNKNGERGLSFLSSQSLYTSTAFLSSLMLLMPLLVL